MTRFMKTVHIGAGVTGRYEQGSWRKARQTSRHHTFRIGLQRSLFDEMPRGQRTIIDITRLERHSQEEFQVWSRMKAYRHTFPGGNNGTMVIGKFSTCLHPTLIQSCHLLIMLVGCEQMNSMSLDRYDVTPGVWERLSPAEPSRLVDITSTTNDTRSSRHQMRRQPRNGRMEGLDLVNALLASDNGSSFLHVLGRRPGPYQPPRDNKCQNRAKGAGDGSTTSTAWQPSSPDAHGHGI